MGSLPIGYICEQQAPIEVEESSRSLPPFVSRQRDACLEALWAQPDWPPRTAFPFCPASSEGLGVLLNGRLGGARLRTVDVH